jgi:hypothetical protein
METHQTPRKGRPPFIVRHDRVALPPSGIQTDTVYLEYRTKVAAQFRAKPQPRVPGLVSITARGSDADRGRSWPEIVAPLIAVICDLEIVDGEHLVGAINVRWSPQVERGWIELETRQASPPITGHRIVEGRRQAAEAAGRAA